MNEDESEAIKASSTRSQSPDPWWKRLPPTDDLAKLVAVASAVLYGILFLGYRSYYVALQIDPEEVGVTNSFVLARVFGFILITFAVGAIVVGYLFIATSFTPDSMTWSDGLRFVAMGVLGVALAYYLNKVFPPSAWLSFGWLLGALFVIAVLLSFMKRSSFAAYWPVAFTVVAVLLSVAIPSIAVVQQATLRGQHAREGQTVGPFDLFTIPIVDVSAPRIRLHWANPAIPYSRGLFGYAQFPEPAEGVLLGHANNIVIANVRVGTQYRVVRFNAAAVVVELL